MYVDLPLNMKPGFYKEDTPFAARQRFIGGNMVHFWKGRPERWRGWQKLTSSSLGGPARGSVAWTTLDGIKCVAWGTNSKLWLYANGTLYDITPSALPAGITDAFENTAWGGGPSSRADSATWGAGTWGGADPSAGIGGRNPRTWSLAVYGEDLVAAPRGGKIYWWDRTSGFTTAAVAVTGSGVPTSVLGLVITPERYLVAWGINTDPLLLAWPKQETLGDWTIGAPSTAGDLRTITDGNEIVGAIPVMGGYLMLTDLAAYTLRYTGSQFVYGTERVAGKSGIVGPNAGAELGGAAYWWGNDHFYSYDGSIKALDCDVHAYVFDDVNRLQSHKIFCGTNRRYKSVIWFYPSRGSTECDRYVELGPDGWSTGALERTTWLDDSIAADTPIATDGSGNIFLQDVGTTDHNGNEIAYELETGDVVLSASEQAAGNTNFRLRKLIPDFDRVSGEHEVVIEARAYPNNAARTKGPYSWNADTKAFSVRARAAAARFKFTGRGDFRMGLPIAKATRDGARGSKQ
jgi:hypothetical protein